MMQAARVLAAVATASVLGTAAAAQLPGAGGGDAPIPSVVVVEMALSDVTPSFDFVGRAEAAATVELRARVEGFLETRDFREGAQVSQGDRLFMIEQAPYEIVVQQRRADLAGAQATAENARSDYERRRALLARNNTSQASVDDARAALGTAEAAVQQAEAALARAELDLTYTEITSPIDGVVSAARYDVGNLVGSTSDPLATVTSVDPIYVTVEISDRLLIQSRQAGMLDIEDPPVQPFLVLADGAIYPYGGEFDYLSPSVNPETDTVTGRAVFPNPDGVLVPGQLVTVSARDKQPISAVLAPQAAVQEDRDGYFVLIVTEESLVEMRRVEVNRQLEDDWVIASGLEEGERIILRGLQKVRVGEPVNAVVEEG